MFIMEASGLKRILENLDSGRADRDQVEITFAMHRDSMAFYSEHSNATPTHQHLQNAALFIKERVGVIASPDQVASILELFPSARIKLAVYDGAIDSEVRDLLYDAVCSFFAGCKAPVYRDDMNMDRFIDHLHSQARQMGYKISDN